MTTQHLKSNRVWTIAEAKARLSEILRLAEEEGPQRIGARRPFVVVPAAAWEEKTQPRKPFGQWLIENVPRGANLEEPDRSSNRMIPFIDEVEKGVCSKFLHAHARNPALRRMSVPRT